MNDRGLLASFLICKIGVALAALAFLGVALSMHSSLGRLAEREELSQVADAIAGAINAADALPGETEMLRKLPSVAQQFEVVMTGERNGGVQVVSVRVIAETEVERVLMLSSKVNGGEFTLTAKNPREIRLVKAGAIQLELV
ncbi:MAG: hypothetical protein QMD95_04335 [Candidatus Hodarchaeaceae archaeon]|nr:hypothetical protein [Candidatus Hodarchaeaceae archaeon]